MYQHYYYNVNVDDKGRHEVHTGTCLFKPSPQNLRYIGYEASCAQAIQKAILQTGKYNFDGCYHCCRECHKG